MQGVPDGFDHAPDRAEFKRIGAGLELFRAHIVRHAFEPHTHQAFGLGVVEAGVERFRYRGSEHLAPAGSLILMNPDELHTGRAETAGGWRYRMLYIDNTALDRVSGEQGWWFDHAVGLDAPRAQRVGALLQRLWAAADSLQVDCLLSTLLNDELRAHARVARPAQSEGAVRFAPVIEAMRARLAERVTLADLSAVVGLSPFHFLRRFKAQHHVTPQQMLMALRLFKAKQLLESGLAPAQVAASVGLADQAHLTRAFVCRYGTTPGRYRAQAQGTPQQAGTRPPH
jgi:AraC-like DNA-binding protein